MPNIPYCARNFENKLPGSRGMVSATWAKYLWSAAKVGKKDRKDLLQNTPYSILEIIARILRIQANLRTRKDFLVKSPNYKRLDPTEKAYVQYAIGQTNAKLIAEVLFKTPWLMHLSLYEKDMNVAYVDSERPDLIGLNKFSEWIVIEAKATGGKLDKATLSKAKSQTRSISTINGSFPKLRGVVGTQFDNTGILELVLIDPEDKSEKPPAIEIDQDIFFLSYYRPIVDLLEKEEMDIFEKLIGFREFHLVSLPNCDLQIGLDSKLHDILRRKDGIANDIIEYLTQSTTTDNIPDEVDSIPIEIASDGIIVIPGLEWNDSAMSIDDYVNEE